MALYCDVMGIPAHRIWKPPFLTVSRFFAHGFQLNGIRVFGSVVCLQDFWLQWKPSSVDEVTPESLAFLKLFKPLPEMLVLGCGDTIKPVSPALFKFLRQEEIALEALDTVSDLTSCFRGNVQI